MAESEEELKSLLRMKEESERDGLKLNIQKTKIMASGPITSWQIEGENWKQWQILFSWASKSLEILTGAMQLRCLFLGRKPITNLDSILKSRDITLLTKVHLVKAICFPSSHVWIWELDHKEGWVPKNWCFQSMVLENSRQSLGQQRDQTSQS